jgi:spoIIIJ-associated protein
LPTNQPSAVYSLLRSVIDQTGLQLSFVLSGDLDSGHGTPVSVQVSVPVTIPDGRQLLAEFSGPDTAMLTARNGELLHALEHLAAKVLRLEPEEHDRVSFDAGGYKATRGRMLQESADRGIASVRSTGQPYSFAVMNSRERRLLHLTLKESGLPTASSGEMPRRFVVLYPETYEPTAEGGISTVPVFDRVEAIRSSFRRREGSAART